MTPGELADQMDNVGQSLESGMGEGINFHAAAAMLREAERLLRENYRRDADWVFARHAWLEGRTP